MIRYKDKVFEDLFIDPETAGVTDKDGKVRHIYLHRGRREIFLDKHKVALYVIMMHTYKGYKEGLIIHHIDGNKLNDSLRNLQYLTQAEHAKLHMSCRSISEKTRHKLSDYMKAVAELCNEDERHHRFATFGMKGKKHSQATKQLMSERASGKKWWNNGVENKSSRDCPGDGWVKGMIKHR